MARSTSCPRAVWLLVLCVALGCAPAVAQTHYVLTLDVDYASGGYEGEMDVTYTNRTPQPLTELFFRLYANAPTLYAGASTEILNVRVGDDVVESRLSVDDTALRVPLPQSLLPDQTTSVTLSFRGQASLRLDPASPPTHDYGILTKTPYTLTLTSFYPIVAPYLDDGWALDPVVGIGDALFAESSSYDVSLYVDPQLTPIASGLLVDAALEGDRVMYRFLADHARDFSLVLVDDGRIPRRATAGGVNLRVWFPPSNTRAAVRAVERARVALALYTDRIGPLPYEELDIVEVPLQHIGGVELSGLILVSERYTADPYDLFFDILVSHEVAHEWFYAAVGNDPFATPWLDEGLATYLSNVFLAEAVSPTVAYGERERWHSSLALAADAHPEIPLTSPLDAFPDSATYSAFAYSGAAWELELIRAAIGDEAFFAGLADYYSQSLFEIASPLDLREAFEAACGCSVAGSLFPDRATP